MCGSLEKRGDGERQTERERDRDRPGFKGPFGLLLSRRTKKEILKTHFKNILSRNKLDLGIKSMF